MLKLVAITLLVLFPSLALADSDIDINVGAGKGIFQTHQPFERMISGGYQQMSSGGIFVRFEMGYFLDNSGNGKSSLWVAPLVGIEPRTTDGIAMHFAVGPGYLQNPDHILGGHFQFSLEAGGGIRDTCGRYFGAVWKHLSSASIYPENQGRDFPALQVRVPTDKGLGACP
jgi:Lipid A 3-O-deacylase (PagL)